MRPLEESVVRLLTKERAAAGGGFLLDEHRILSSVDSVARALGLESAPVEPPEGSVRLDFPLAPRERLASARVILWRPAAGEADALGNLAVLGLDAEARDAGRAAAVRAPADDHYDVVMDAISDGELVPFFGAGVNLCGRPRDAAWKRGQYLPSGAELSAYLAREFRYPGPDKYDLVRVSQYVALMRGLGPLNNRLRHVFNDDYPPTSLHKFFATLPDVLRRKGYPPYQLIVTTNYDDVLERAFREAGEAFDLITYVVGGGQEQRGKFLHWLPDGEVRLIEKPNEYRLPLDEKRHLQRPVILKIHGAIDRATPGPQPPPRDSFVITEDHYIDYLTRSDISNLVPVTLAEKLQGSSFLFLGYKLRDWNLRVILHRIWMRQQDANYKSWAIQLEPEELEQEYWKKRDVEIFNARLEDYIAKLGRRLEGLPGAGD